jgi:hypothetical protein
MAMATARRTRRGKPERKQPAQRLATDCTQVVVICTFPFGDKLTQACLIGRNY